MGLLIILFGALSTLLAGFGTLHVSDERTLGSVAAGYFFAALCLLCILRSNMTAATQALADAARGWYAGGAVMMVLTTALSVVALLRLRATGRSGGGPR